MLIKKKINFALEFRRKGTKKNGNNEVNQENLPLRMRVSYNNMRIEFVTGYRIDANKWDAENQRATGMTKLMQTASEVNDYRKIVVDKKMALELAGQPTFHRRGA